VSFTKFAHVHAWYHGGEQLESIAESIARDVHERNIGFPTFGDLKRPIRSTVDGILLDVQKAGATNFAQWVTRHILIYPVDWVKTSRGISTAIHQNLENHSEMKVEVVSFGPSSESLFESIKSQASNPKVEFSDFSSFKATKQQSKSTVQEDGVAIVGMGIDFPKGKGQKELWETLSKGVCAVQEVRSLGLRFLSSTSFHTFLHNDRFQSRVSTLHRITPMVMFTNLVRCQFGMGLSSKMSGALTMPSSIYHLGKHYQWIHNNEYSFTWPKLLWKTPGTSGILRHLSKEPRLAATLASPRVITQTTYAMILMYFTALVSLLLPSFESCQITILTILKEPCEHFTAEKYLMSTSSAVLP
jgi:Beta-ketoacyl synthase, N-terminal domain